MQTTTATQATPRPLIFARHLIGMGIVALANPLIYYSDQPAFRWLETWATPIVLALVAYGLYALFLTQRAKAGWPKSFFILAWVLLTLLVAGPWINKPRSAQSTALTQNTQAIDRDSGKLTAPTQQPQQGSQIDEILKDAPAYQPAR